jgi:hypothetical protein
VCVYIYIYIYIYTYCAQYGDSGRAEEMKNRDNSECRVLGIFQRAILGTPATG